jgi:tRNA dimethylallyltransferase
VSEKTQILAIVGATGTGKSDLSLDVAEALIAQGHGVEIVNADAMQLYAGMDIGTAKLPEAERRGIPHHMFDVLAVTDEAAVADYQTQARSVIAEINARGNLAILVGGSGLYVSSVLFDFDFPGHVSFESASKKNWRIWAGVFSTPEELFQGANVSTSRTRDAPGLGVLEVTGSTADWGPYLRKLSIGGLCHC